MIALMLALTVLTPQEQPQEARATLQGCRMEDGRWVCRYQMPEIEIVPVQPGGGPVNRMASASADPPPAPIVQPAITLPPITDVGALTEDEARLVSRCADAGWLSLCLPAERRAARDLREKARTHEALRLTVTRLLSENRCDDAVRTALEGGALNLATQARAFCAAAGPAEAADVADPAG